MGGAEVVPSTGRSARRVAPAEVAARSRPQPQRKQRQRKRRNKFLRRKIDNVATEKSLQKRAARRFPLWESGGGATYQVPLEVPPARQISLATRWIVQYADTRKGMPMAQALAQEIKDAAAGQGNAIKKREDTHKMAQANRAFAHFRW